MNKMNADTLADLVLMAERLGAKPAAADLSKAKGRFHPHRLWTRSLELPLVRKRYSASEAATLGKIFRLVRFHASD
jgi:hypothetical protein